MNDQVRGQQGFTLLEMLLATAIFLIICGAMFELLHLSQQKYSSESQLTSTYQDARLAMDQIVRDVNASGFPGTAMFSPVPASNPSSYAIGPVAWSPNYPLTPCTLGSGGTCTVPGPYDLIVETRLPNDPQVSWIWYHLGGTTLYREVVSKASGDPWSMVNSSSSTNQAPLVTNVMNNPSSGQLGQITSQYPSMFPGGGPQPVFQYSCSMGTTTQPCASAGSNNSPKRVSDVDVTLIVMTPQQDLQTQELKLVELNGRGHRINPMN